MRRRPKDSPLVRLSKKLTWALRHGIAKLGLSLTPSGYVTVAELLACREFSGLTQKQLEEIVHRDEKQRFKLINEAGELMIRANQGHSIEGLADAEIYQPIEDPHQFAQVFHGTYKKVLGSVERRGLFRMQRTHIHLATGMPGAGHVISGARRNCDCVIEIDLPQAMSDGIPFFLSANQVVLTPGLNGFLSNKYFKSILVDGRRKPMNLSPLDLDYILVLDFEANAIDGGKLECQEIIEFPVRVVNARTGELGGVFHHYVRPTVVPQLTEFIIGLTGIQQSQVDNGALLPEVIELFSAFLAEQNLLEKKWVFLTYGDWDLKSCLKNELKFKHLTVADYFKRWLNIRTLMPVHTKDIIDMLGYFSIPHEGRHHSGLDDVENITKALLAMLQSGMKFYREDVRTI